MPTIDWNVKNAINRDVERQHLNKILADIRASFDSVNKTSTSTGSGNVKDQVGEMVSNNSESGISVTYNSVAQVLNFAVSSFLLTLAGDVSGSASITPGGSATLTVTIDPSKVGLSDAPADSFAYWRRGGVWETVGPNIEQLQVITGPGLASLGTDGIWNMREIEGPMSVVVTEGDGDTANPSLALVNDEVSPGGLESYATNQAGVKGWYKPALFESTGLLDGGTITLGVGNTFDIAQAIVGYTDYISGPATPTRNVAVYGPSTGNVVPNIAVLATYVGVQTPGVTLVMQSSPFTPTQRRTIVPLGAVISNGTNLIAVNNLPDVMRAGINQIQDFMEAVGPIKKSGNVISANGANLQINKSAGVLFKQGANFQLNEEDPHNLPLAALTASSFNYRTSTGIQGASTTSIDVTQYESPLGTLATVPNNRFTIQRIYIFTSNLIRIQYGQTVYQTMAEAEATLTTEAFAVEQNIADNGVLLAFLIVEKSATALNNPAQAKFIPSSKFGGPIGSGGTSITNTDSLAEGSVNLYFTDARARTAVSQTGLYSARPTAVGNAGLIYYATDVRESYRSNGTTWSVIHGAGNELGYAERTSTFTTTSLTLVDVPGMSVTFTAGERPVSINFGSTLRNQTSGEFTRLALILDGSPVAQLLTQNTQYYGLSRQFRASGFTPGTSHTAKIQVLTTAAFGAGIAEVFGDPVDRPYLQVVNC